MALASEQNTKPVRDQVSSEEWEKRVDLAACYRLMHVYGLTEMVANHISARVPGEDGTFLINPYGMLYEEMHASCFLKIDLDGNILFNPTEYDVNKAGYVIHSAIHAARHDVDCCIHTHSLEGMAVSAMKVGVLPIAQTAMRHSDIAYHDYEGPALNLDERERLVNDLGNREVMILRNHGLLAVGPTIAECFNNIFQLERACQLQVMTLSCNAEIQYPPEEVIRHTQEGFKRGRKWGKLEWPALLRKLDRIDPSFRD